MNKHTRRTQRRQADGDDRHCKCCGSSAPSARETGVCMMCELRVKVALWQAEARRYA